MLRIVLKIYLEYFTLHKLEEVFEIKIYIYFQ